MLKITGTFLDEISHDIPHQNWGRKEWERDFLSMKETGIDTVILIRCGHRRFLTYPSDILMKERACYRPPIDLVDLFLELSERYGMAFYFGTFCAGHSNFAADIDLHKRVVDEVWKRYGHRPAFKGWYLSAEVSTNTAGIIPAYAEIGKHCKGLSNNLPVLISPYIKGVKIVESPEDVISIEKHEREWNDILGGIQGAVDIVAFQDGHVDYDDLPAYLELNARLAAKYNMQSWTNCESFDRDMPIRFLPIKFEKLLLKLEAAQKAHIPKAITFEYSHFMSPNSCYLQARHLHDRYMEHIQG